MLILREREHANGRGIETRDREGERETQAHTDTELGPSSWTLRLWPQLKSRVGCLGAPGQLSWLRVQFISGHDLTIREFELHIRLCADNSEPEACFRFCVFLSLSALPLLMLCLSLHQKINIKKIKRKISVWYLTNWVTRHPNKWNFTIPFLVFSFCISFVEHRPLCFGVKV